MKKSNEILENIINDIKQSVAKFYKDTERIEKIKMKEDLYNLLKQEKGILKQSNTHECKFRNTIYEVQIEIDNDIDSDYKIIK